MLYVISGSSCGGKTTLINALASRGYFISNEPGRNIVRKELDSGGDALPWKNPVAFATNCVELSVQRYDAATHSEKMIFFDRSLIDAVSALAYEEPNLAEQHLQILRGYRYANTVFMAPFWPEFFENDSERKQSFGESVAEYERLVAIYTMVGYSVRTLPKVSVPKYINFVLEHIE